MKRPKGIYLVATWCFLALLFQTGPLTKLSKAYMQKGIIAPFWLTPLILSILVFAIYEAITLVRLERLACWLCIAFLGAWTLTMAWRQFTMPSAHRFAVAFLVISGINVAVIWYLSCPSFRQLCSDFRKERDKAKMERNVTRQMSKHRVNEES